VTGGRGEISRQLLAALALVWTGLALLWALQILLPAPTFTLWFFTVLAKESSLLLAGFASLGVALAVLVRFFGARRTATVAAALGTAAVFLSLVPMVQAWKTARAEDAPLSPSEQFSGPSTVAEGPTETVTYADPEGEELKLDVWRPSGGAADGSRGRPAVVLVHGGGWHAGTRGHTPLWDAWLAEKGYVVFDIDYRLAPPPRWQDAPGDVKCAVGWVRENAARYGVDPGRISLVGHSAGGHLALLAAYSEGDGRLPSSCGTGDAGVAAVAAFYPPTDLRRLYEMEWPWSRPNFVGLEATKHFLGGTPSVVPGRYRISSPTTHVDPEVPPTFLVHGAADRTVPSGQSRLLAERLAEVGAPHRYLELPWADHSFDHASDLSWGGSGAQVTRSALGEFLDRHLALEADPEAPDG